MKLSTMRLSKTLYLVAERFVKSDDSVHLQLCIKDATRVILCAKGQVCEIGIGNEPKDIRYFKQIRKQIQSVSEQLISDMGSHAVLEDIYIDEDSIVTFILAGIFDSY